MKGTACPPGPDTEKLNAYRRCQDAIEIEFEFEIETGGRIGCSHEPRKIIAVAIPIPIPIPLAMAMAKRRGRIGRSHKVGH